MEMTKERILKGANVLIVSDKENHYRETINYGFTHVDYFASEVCAYEYFRKHKSRFNSYDIIIIGDLVTRKTVMFNSGLDKMIEKLKRRKQLAIIKESDYAWKSREEEFGRETEESEREFFNSILDDIVKRVSINGLEEAINKKRKTFSPLVMPYKKGNTVSSAHPKILFCYPNGKLPFDVDKALGVWKFDIDVVEKDDASFGSVVNHLGDYDIIISSLSLLSEAAIESREQCKMTGREASLLVTYDKETFHNELDKGTDTKLAKIELNITYVRGGSNWQDQKKVVKLRLPFQYQGWENSTNTYIKRETLAFRALIFNVFYQYDNLLKDIGNDSELFLESDSGYLSQRHYDKVYDRTLDEVKKQIDIEYRPVKQVVDIETYVSKFCKYRNRGLVQNNSNTIRINESTTGYRVEVTHKGQLALCALTFSKNGMSQSYKIVSLRKLGSKKKLGEERTLFVGVDFENRKRLLLSQGQDDIKTIDSISRDDIKAIALVHQTVMETIKPLVDAIDNEKTNTDRKEFINRPASYKI